jgi:predicted outer membrane repeat protein
MLASGTYAGPGNRDISFRGKAITVTSESGAASAIINCQGLGGGFVFSNNEGHGSILSDITVTNGIVSTASNTPASSMTHDEYISRLPSAVFGGAVNIVSGSPTITGNIFTNCTATVGGAVNAGPGAAVIENNLIDGCSASYGGGIFYANSPDVLIAGNTIQSCSAINGGGINSAGNGSGIIRDNTIQSCYASQQGGGIFCDQGSHPEIINNLITGNTVGYVSYGAGIALFQSDSHIAFNTISLNIGDPTGRQAVGGGIYCRLCQDTIEDNELDGNTATDGGGIYFSMDDPGTPVVRNNVFRNNSAINGGGSYVQIFFGEPVWFFNCDFISNTASGSGGGAVYGHYDGCLFRGNSASNEGGGLFGGGFVTNCHFEGNSASIGGGITAGTITNCLFISNTATHFGGGISNAGGTVSECTLVGNGAPRGSGISLITDPNIRNSIIAFGTQGEAIYCRTGVWWANPHVYCNDIFANAGGGHRNLRYVH